MHAFIYVYRDLMEIQALKEREEYRDREERWETKERRECLV